MIDHKSTQIFIYEIHPDLKYGALLLASSATCATGSCVRPRATEGKFFSADSLPDLAGYSYARNASVKRCRYRSSDPRKQNMEAVAWKRTPHRKTSGEHRRAWFYLPFLFV